MTLQIQQFAEVARQFCIWAEGEPGSPEIEALRALQFLSKLYQLGLDLPPMFGDEEAAEVPHEEWMKVYRRFGSLPFNYYMQCGNPQDVPADVPGVADLADDLADIWRDLKRGLGLFNAGNIPAATWEWRQSFWHHWGTHSTGGIFALHNWLSVNSQSAI